MDRAQKVQRCNEYIDALEEERRKIQVFQRELPLCLELVTQAIDTCRQQLSGTITDYLHGQSECSEQTSSEGGGPVLEEFIPMKRTSFSDDDEDDDDDERQSNKPSNNIDKSAAKKSDWLRSVQLWNQTPDQPIKQDPPRKVSVIEVKSNGGAFHSFRREKGVATAPPSMGRSPSSAPTAATSSTADTVTGGSGGSRREDKEGQSSQRKSRRCWSPELHKRFLLALKQLGGSHVATPKQIRELMKVDGLTNDEVKSHLQKYRLHTRRPSSAIHNNGNPQAPQFLVVGGIWVPPPEYAAVAATTTSGEAAEVPAANGIYAPVAAPPPPPPLTKFSESLTQQRQQQKQSNHLHSEERGSRCEGNGRSSSPATSSSTHTTTASPVF